MDAISFVMGEKTSSLRVKRLNELIHGASVGKPVSRSASVTAIFELEDGTEKSFTRIVLGSSSEHRINDEVDFASFCKLCSLLNCPNIRLSAVTSTCKNWRGWGSTLRPRISSCSKVPLSRLPWRTPRKELHSLRKSVGKLDLCFSEIIHLKCLSASLQLWCPERGVWQT